MAKDHLQKSSQNSNHVLSFQMYKLSINENRLLKEPGLCGEIRFIVKGSSGQEKLKGYIIKMKLNYNVYIQYF